ncbi:hypothetical protein [Pedobacter sp. NJ-S-72]
MRHYYRTAIKDGYKGWEIFISKGYSYSNDLKVTISPGVQMDKTVTQHLSQVDSMKFNMQLQNKRVKHSHELRIQATKTLFIFQFVTPWIRAREKAKKFIDSRLGNFNLQKFIYAP